MHRHLTQADWLSFLRIVLTPLLLILLTGWAYKYWAGVLLVGFAIISDYLDGHWARKYNLTSTFGAFLDFTADKVFVLSLLTIFTVKSLLPLWMLLVILNRELIVMGLRLLAAVEGLAVPAHILGKIKTTFTFAGILAILIHQIISPWIQADLAWIPYWLMVIAVVLTVISGIDYFLKINKYLLEKRELKN